MTEPTRKSGWYLPLHIFDAIENIAMETKDKQGKIVENLIVAGLTKNAYSLQSERIRNLSNYYDSVFKRLLICMSRTPKGGNCTLLNDVLGGLSIVSHTKRSISTALFFDFKELLDEVKNKSPDIYKEYMNSIRKYPKIYKEVRTIEPQNRTVLTPAIINNNKNNNNNLVVSTVGEEEKEKAYFQELNEIRNGKQEKQTYNKRIS